MKQFILVITILFFHISGFSVESTKHLINRNNSFLSIEEKQPELKVFPNPCRDKKITIELINEELLEIRLTNIAGKEILLKKFESPVNKQQLQLVNVPNGIYLIQVKTTGNRTFVKKLLVSTY